MSDNPLPTDYSRSRAVLIGAWDYSALPAVPAARNSLKRMRGLLTGPLCAWPGKRVDVIRNERSRGSLPDRLMEAFSGATDVALFYFVGHGQLHDDELCLALCDSPAGGPRRTTVGLPFADVRRALHECDARTKIVILDCCFAGQAARAEHSLTEGTASLIDRTLGTGAFTMAASGAYRTAWYEPAARTATPQTYFTKYLVDTVEAGLPGHPQGLSLGAVFTATAEALSRDRLPAPTRSVRHDADRFVLARNARASAEGTGADTGRDAAAPGPRPRTAPNARRRSSARVAAIAVGCVAVVGTATAAGVIAADLGHRGKDHGAAAPGQSESSVSEPHTTGPAAPVHPTTSSPAPAGTTPTTTPPATPHTTEASETPANAAADVDFPEPCDLPSRASVRDFNLQLPGTDSNYNTALHQECLWNGAGVDLFGIGYTTNPYKKGPIATDVPGAPTSSALINDAGICMVSWPTSYGSAFAYADVDPSEEEDKCDAAQAWAGSMYVSMPS
ncbi:caspase domain-containing protein [Streptomyces sp. NPDC020983]|uniref:caspase domain-containing protein n=1 Tax=Streptomyces sp. NPDC020983 TaxID=3365106 RepID=UPI0037B45830